MSDLIDRQEAIDAIRASTKKYTGFMEMEMYTDDDAVEAIEGLPSAEPYVLDTNVGVNKRAVLDILYLDPGIDEIREEMIKNLPSAQPEIIRCKDCQYYEADIMANPWGVCCHSEWVGGHIGHEVSEDGWCYRAERREG